MNVRRALLVLCLAFLPVTSFAIVGADMGITATDSPDPVAPDGNITYTIHVTNAGPATATTAHLNVINNGTLLWQSTAVPAGWTCPAQAVGFGGSFTCTAATLASGSNDTFTIVMNAGKAQFGINDQTINQLFTVNATESDPNSANNNVTVSTSYVAPHADMQVTATDAPDPVAPDGNITYTVNVTNAGPDATTNAAMSVFGNNTLLFQSITVPAGWTCPAVPVGNGGGFTCHAATMGVATSTFTVVLKAAKSQIGVFDQTLNQLFTVGSDWADPVNGNNAVTVQTAYVAPHADLQVTATDAPDPVAPDGNITYTVTVVNAGPDAATNASMSAVNNTLQFQSISVPSGWTCPALSPGQGGAFTCTAATLATPSTSVFTIVLKAAKAQYGPFNQTINEVFVVSNDWSDPVNGNNTASVSTAYVPPSADLQITATDSPDPVFPDGNITYTVTVTNAGPDATTNAQMSAVNNTLKFQSISIPSGWTCPALSAGQGGAFTCTAANLATPSTSVFTIVLKAAQAQYGNSSQTINQVFVVSSDWSDPVNGNNTANVSTAYVTPSVDLSVTATDAPDPVNADGNITYSVAVTNSGPDTGSNVILNVPLNNTLLFQSISAPAGWSCTPPAVNGGTSFSCTASTMAAPTTANFTIVLKAAFSQFGNSNQTISQNFNVNSSASDPNNANNSVVVTTSYVVPQANLAVTNSDAPDPVNSGGTITYTQTITNNGPDAAANAHITESIGSGVTFQSLVSPGGWSCTTPAIGGTGVINCSIASLANAGSASFTVVVNVTAVSGSISNTIAGSSDAADSVPANNSATATTTITPLPTADLGITKSTPTTNAAPGAAVVYTIVLTNHGPDTATSVTMTDTLPATLLFQSISAPAGYVCTTPTVGTTGTISCTGSSLANGATATFTLNVTSVSNANGAIANTASVTGTPSDPTPGNNSQTSSFTAGSADLALSGGSGTSGAFITYTFGLTNGGPSTATGVVFTDTLPPSLLFQSITAPPGFTCTTPPVGTSGTITCTASSFVNGATGTFTIVTTAAPGTTGPINNSAGVSSATSDPNSGNSTFTAPPVTAPATDVPALSTWALMLLAAILGAGALMKMR
ncbi:MAG: IPTL-CTERM sorting domain-containing protein [Acidobacteria bacterium]|nr:IPTL-CTERM sorting domain-containing protein [Acidobacteriota bacterium]MBV9188712.1 IPTL-CTERM sorting domain-containing protein [Acidobacteriota bacterium]